MPSERRTFMFDAIYVLQYLGDRDEPTGESLYREAIEPLARQIDIHAEFTSVGTRHDLLQALTNIAQACKEQRRQPILHLETHGTPDGIAADASEMVTWEELKPILTAINQSSRVSLLVTLAACHGLHLGKTLRTTDRAPLWALIGPDHQVLPTDVRRCFTAFYGEFLANLDLNAALQAMRAADGSNPYTWKIQTAEVFLAYIFGEFMAKASDPIRVKQEEDAAVAMLLRKGPADLEKVRAMRMKARAILTDSRRDFVRMKSRFLMLDQFPENAARFPSTFEEVLQIHAAVKALIAEDAA